MVDRHIREAIFDGELWFQQLLNVASTLAWIFGVWILLTSVMVGSCMSIFIIVSESPTYSEVRLALISMVVFVGFINAIVAIGFGITTRLKNVFSVSVEMRISRYKEYKREFSNHQIRIDDRLVQLGFITQAQIDVLNKGQSRNA